jgi:hypothetical protein
MAEDATKKRKPKRKGVGRQVYFYPTMNEELQAIADEEFDGVFIHAVREACRLYIRRKRRLESIREAGK